MRHCAKFCENRSNRCGDMAFFDFSKMAAVLICCPPVWTIHEKYLVVVVIVQNLVGIGAVVSIICKF